MFAPLPRIEYTIIVEGASSTVDRGRVAEKRCGTPYDQEAVLLALQYCSSKVELPDFQRTSLDWTSVG